MKPIFPRATFLLLSLVSAHAQIAEIEVNQAIGRQFKGALSFTAGKATVVRAFLNEAATIDPATTNLLIERNGQRVAQLAPRSYDQPVRIVEFLCPTREDCGGWAEGDYLFTATVNGARKSTEGTAITFRPRQPLRIMARPVRGHYSGNIVQVDGDRWKKAVEWIKAAYPVAPEAILWDIKDEFDASDARFDLDTDAGQLALWQGLTNLVPQECAANRQLNGCYDLILGFVQQRPGKGTLQGYTFGAPTNIVVSSDADMEATVLHEIAHVYGAGDTYDGGSLHCAVNPAPDGYTGKDFNNPANQTSCREGKKAFPGVSGTLITADEARAYELGGRGALGDYACFMGSGGKLTDYWISPEIYQRLFDQLDPAKFKPQRPVKSAGEPARLLHFSGFLAKSGQLLKEPWYTFLSTEPVPNTQGDLTLRVLNAAGATVASQRLDVKFTVNSNPPRELDSAPFDGAVLLPDTAARLVIVDKDGKTVWESAVAASDPEVSAITPATGAVNGPQTIQWSARQSGNANGQFFYVVEYNPAPANPNSEWIVLAADLDKPTWTEDFDELPGGPEARLRIWATDGIRAGLAQSGALNVRVKEPYVAIEPAPASVKRGADLLLGALVEDLQEDNIPDAKIVWTSSLSGRLGTGTDIAVKNLPAGEHVITVTATNSLGVSGTDRVTVRVE